MPTVSFSGIASGIDGDAIIKTLLESRRVVTIPMKNQIAHNDSESEALTELKTKLGDLGTALSDLSNLVGGSIAKSAATSNADALSASATNAAVPTSVAVNILQLAKSGSFSFNDRFTSIDEAIAPSLSGPTEISITIGSGDAEKVVDVTVDATTTLRDIASQISENSDGKLIGSVVNAGTQAAPQYLLLVNGTASGTEQGQLSIAVSDELSAAGVFQNYTLDQAEDAIIEVSGIGQVRRSTNQVADIIPGVTLDLRQAGTGPVQVTVNTDPDKTAGTVADIIGRINEIINYSRENGKVTRSEDEDGKVTNSYGSLAKTTVDDQFVEGLRSALSQSVSSIAGSAVRVFADLGITTERDGTLKFDQQKFVESVGKDPSSAEQILASFADKLSSTGGVIGNFIGYNRAIDLALRANESANDSANKRIQAIEANIEKEGERLRLVFANLEKTIGRLNSESSSLTALLAGLNS